MKKEISLKVAKFKSEVEKAKRILVKTAGAKVKSLDIQIALAMHFNIQHAAQLVDKDLNAKEIVEILKDYDFFRDNSAIFDEWVKNMVIQ